MIFNNTKFPPKKNTNLWEGKIGGRKSYAAEKYLVHWREAEEQPGLTSGPEAEPAQSYIDS